MFHQAVGVANIKDLTLSPYDQYELEGWKNQLRRGMMA
jgi:hypothetical protein